LILAMNLLIIVTSDPRLSPRPAEAVRIAAGVAVWGQVRVTLWLGGPAALGLDEVRDDLCDAGVMGRHLVVLQQAGGRVLVAANSPHLADIHSARVPFEAVNEETLADLACEHDTVTRF
jgi:hypothetical protein